MLPFLAGSAVLQGGIFGLAGLFPGQYTQSVMGGMVRTQIYINATLHLHIFAYKFATNWKMTPFIV